VTLAGTSVSAALAAAHDALQRRLLRYVVETGRGMAIAGWRIADPAHGAVWRCTPFRPSALQLDHAGLGPMPTDLRPLAELFQRARNASDAASRLLAAHAVVAAAARGHPALSRAGVGEFRLSLEMLVHAGATERAAQLDGRSLAVLLAVLQPEVDRLVGAGGLLAAASADLTAEQALARLANLADLVAHRLLLRELRAREPVASHGVPGRPGRWRARAGRALAPSDTT